MSDQEHTDPRAALEVECPGIKIDTWGGWCPVEVEGTIDGLPFHFRARGALWSVSIATTPDGDPLDAFVGGPGWLLCEQWGKWPDAGYMPDDDVRACIVKSVEKWRAERGANADG